MWSMVSALRGRGVRGRSVGWVLVAVVLAAGSAVVLVGAVAALAAAPSFAAVLRLVVEAVAAAVLVGAAWRRSARTPPHG